MITPTQLLAVMQLTDSLFPTGAFTHSNGLETYVQRGTVQDAEGLYGLLATRLHSIARSDMIAVHCVMSTPDKHTIYELDERLSAMKTAKESRDASIKVGKQMLRSALTLMDDATLHTYQQAISAGQCAGHHAIVHGLVYAAQGIDAQTALLAFAYGQTAGQISAAVKLMPIGQTQAQQVLYALIPIMQEAVEVALASRADQMQSFTPALEIHIMQHQYLFRRLFMS